MNKKSKSKSKKTKSRFTEGDRVIARIFGIEQDATFIRRLSHGNVRVRLDNGSDVTIKDEVVTPPPPLEKGEPSTVTKTPYKDLVAIVDGILDMPVLSSDDKIEMIRVIFAKNRRR